MIIDIPVWRGEMISFDDAGTSVLRGLTRTLTFYGTLTNQVSGSIPEKCHSPGDTNCLLLYTPTSFLHFAKLFANDRERER
jgi:hypothetical protein